MRNESVVEARDPLEEQVRRSPQQLQSTYIILCIYVIGRYLE